MNLTVEYVEGDVCLTLQGFLKSTPNEQRLSLHSN